MPADYRTILDLLPVRHPFVLVDRVVALTPGERIETLKLVSGSEPCFAGLAEGLPASRYAYPRSLLIESLAQSAALLWLHDEQTRGERAEWVLLAGGMRGCKVFASAYPGDAVRHTVRLDRVVDGSTAFLTGESRIGDRLICTVESLVAVRRPRASVLRGEVS